MKTRLEELQERSASPRELILAFSDAMSALDTLESHGTRVLAWEGWLRYRDGRLGHSGQHQGTIDLSTIEFSAAFDLCRSTIREADEVFRRDGERDATELLFCITHDGE